MELSVSTIVVFVLSMSVLVLGIFLIQKIFSVSTTAIDGIDSRIKTEIETLFSTDDGTKFSTFPRDRIISIERGERAGFGFSLRNIERSETKTLSWKVSAEEVSPVGCMTTTQAESLIALGREGSSTLGPGQILEDPAFVMFEIPNESPLCLITIKVSVEGYTEFRKVLEII